MGKKLHSAGFGRLIIIITWTLLIALVIMTTGCSEVEETTDKLADYGVFGSRFALSLARQFPNRSPGSEQEKLAGDLIIRTLTDAGYKPDVKTFFFTDATEQMRSSRNIIVKIPGSGFVRTDESGNSESFRRQVIVGAHYDTFFSVEDVAAYKLTVEPTPSPTPRPTGDTTDPDETDDESADEDETVKEPTLIEYDGIHNNASGIGALITLAREINSARLGYDVVIVAFGAGEADQAGARAFADKMTDDEIAMTDVMYCIDSIYAGDKIYAHAGQNSVRGYYRKSYEMRRKLYEVTDVFYEFELYTNNNYMLYTNQGNYDVTIDGISTPILYREWTMTVSDYLPFDDLDIPIVFFESYDYDAKELEDLKESKNPAFTSTSGAIRRTPFDSTAYLNMIMNQQRRAVQTITGQTQKQMVDHLTKRINNTAFVILEAIRKGVHDAEITPDDQDITPAAS
ncbi:MAG: M28 family peptidase [Bacillota bacterium]|nr:M28 family peptidase [Bacillota bacterium]